MDTAYDHIQEELVPGETPEGATGSMISQTNGLKSELTEAYEAMSASPWGARLGGFFGSVKKQSETYIQGARHELASASTEASKGLTELLSQTRAVSLGPSPGDTNNTNGKSSVEKPESLPADIVKEGAAILSRLRLEATARLKQFEKVEDAADEAIAKLGVNVLGFLKEAVTIAPPSEDANGAVNNVQFESKDTEGRRVVHATRLEAQLHVIHTTPASFLNEPVSNNYVSWIDNFNVDGKTVDIAKDLAQYEELRRATEKLVPEHVEYTSFWTRYYFLRHVIEAQEQRRRELLKETRQTEEEEIAWDDEDEDEASKNAMTPVKSRAVLAQTDTIEMEQKLEVRENKGDNLLKPAEPSRSNEHSIADSDTSYDIVSGTTSRCPDSPGPREIEKKEPSKIAEESDEEDWE